MKEVVKVKSVREQMLPGSKTIVTIGELRFYKTRTKLNPYFVSPNDARGFDYDVPKPGDRAVDSYGDVTTINLKDSQSYMKTCLRILADPDQIPAPILKLIEGGHLNEFNRISIEVELVVKVATDKTGEDEVYHKIKFDKDGKVNVVSYERFSKEKEPATLDNMNRVFTLEDMNKCFWLGINSRPVVGANMTAKEICAEPNKKFEDFIQSLKS